MVSNVYAKSSTEYYAKAVFLFKVIDFIKWPDDLSENKDITNICIYGDNPFEGYLQKIADEKVKEQPFVIHYTKDIIKIAECQILFISRSEKYNLAKIITLVAQMPILTVSDIEKFAYKKGMIEIGVNPRKRNFKLKINIDAVSKASIKLSSNLIELATVIYGPDNKVQP